MEEVKIQQNQQQLDVNYIIKSDNQDEFVVDLQIKGPKEGEQKSSAFICILDVSGSMGEDAGINQKGMENFGFTRLDLVKHSMNTIINSMSQNDYLAIVSFHTSAKKEMELRVMDDAGKKQAQEIIGQLYPQDSTNIWDGLQMGMEIANSNECKDKNTVTVLLTDGQPNINPPRGLIETIKSHLEETVLNGTIHAFGFGYNLDSKILYDIANLGNGSFAFIPDCTMVGTVFVNFLSNSLSQYSKKLYVEIERSESYQLQNIPEQQKIIQLGGMQYGQTRNQILIFKQQNDKTNILIQLSVKCQIGENIIVKNLTIQLDRSYINSKQQNIDINYEYSRYKFIKLLQQLIQQRKEQNDDFKNYLIYINKQDFDNDERIKNIILEIESQDQNQGQVKKSVSQDDWFEKWGKHHLRALLRAHELQICINFKDPSIQQFGGQLFKQIQNKADKIFVKLPPPKPSIKKQNIQYQNIKMNQYYDNRGGCFTGEALATVKLDNNNIIQKQVQLLKKGDYVLGYNNQYHQIKCIVISEMKDCNLVNINGLLITPWHPVKINNIWVFPYNVNQQQLILINQVYNLVLETGHSIILNSIECCTLGHHFQDNDVIKHPYFGTNLIIQDLESIQGWNNGLIKINSNNTLRDPITHLIKGIQNQNNIENKKNYLNILNI